MPDSAELALLKKELVGLFGHIQRIRKELATLDPHTSGEDHFSSMTDQLDAIIDATENATNAIMENAEEIDNSVQKLRPKVTDEEAGSILDGVVERVNHMFEACSFQDITGQRITKVVNSLKFVEERVNRVIVMWGKDELQKVVGELEEERAAMKTKGDPDKGLLNGPALPGEGIDQHHVDRLFSQDDIDKLFA